MSSRPAPETKLTIDAAAFRSYRGSGWQPIPLHRYDATSTDKRGRERKDGKRPIHANWTAREYGADAVLRGCERDGLNMGVRLTALQLVIDVDPRHGGEEGFAKLCRDLGLDPLQWPRVETGSGGSHYYLTLPEGVRVVDTLEKYPGVEFKSIGRQVVSAGSIHPDTLRHYQWDKLHPELADAPEAPARLIEAIRRPERSGAPIGGGQLTQEEIAAKLARLDPCEFRIESEWRAMMMSCHHASNGDARSEFIEWSTSDPNYADDAEVIGRRWDSCHAEKNDGYTYKTLNKALRDHGAADAQVIDEDERTGDFDELADVELAEKLDDPDAFEGLPEGEGESEPVKLADVNGDNIDSVFSVVNIGSKARVLYWGKSPIDSTVRVPELFTFEEFGKVLSNKTVVVDHKVTRDGEEKIESKRVPLAKWYLNRRDRYTYDGLVFDAAKEPVSEEDEINLWRGFGVRECEGDWSLLDAHLRDNIAGGDDESYAYIKQWTAWGFQNPTKLAEVALVLASGGKGTGKGVFGRALSRIYGAHGLHISNRAHLVGKFNAHFMQAGLLFCDEALWPGYKDDEGVLKALITEPVIPIEPKGLNTFMMPNALKVLMASNSKWIVPASGDERRFAVFEVSDARKQDTVYFGRIVDQLKNGGLGAMLHDLRTMDLEGWHPRTGIPETKALIEQKEQSLPPELKWLAGYLESGVLDHQHHKHANVVEAGAFYDLARRRVDGLRRWADIDFAKFLNDWGVSLKRSNGAWRRFPSLDDMRAEWQRRMPWWRGFDGGVRDWRQSL
jgi:hypothetical protein